jgi:hypothetical protein
VGCLANLRVMVYILKSMEKVDVSVEGKTDIGVL